MEGQTYGTGRRKEATARVFVRQGEGKIQVNGREVNQYFPREILRIAINAPIEAVALTGSIDVIATVKGGGASGQAYAIQLGLARALKLRSESFRPALKAGGYLTRDPRMVERKKTGLRKARRATQFSKR